MIKGSQKVAYFLASNKYSENISLLIDNSTEKLVKYKISKTYKNSRD